MQPDFCARNILKTMSLTIKNKLPITKDQRSDIMSTLFGDNGIIGSLFFMVSDIVFNMFRAQKSGCIREDIVDCF
jgi:hypothetical protein